MATHPGTPYSTTTTAALTASEVIIKTTASTGFAADKYLVIGKEVMLLVSVDTTNHTHVVKRGMKGTQAVKHESGSVVYLAAAAALGTDFRNGVTLAGYDGDFTAPVLPIGSYWTDPVTGYEYVLCDATSALEAGTPVSIDSAGVATILAENAKGRCGIVTEAVSASDKVCWVLVAGQYASTMTSSSLTTATLLAQAAGYFELWDSSNEQRVWHAGCTVAPSTATSPTYGGGLATVIINHPWIAGVDDFVS